MDWKLTGFSTMCALAVFGLVAAFVAGLMFIAEAFGVGWALVSIGIGACVAFGLVSGMR